MTSQILANIYLNEFDRFMVHKLKPLAYMRYGDDWLCFAKDKVQVEQLRLAARKFLVKELKLIVNPKVDQIKPVYKGVAYLGVEVWPTGRRLQPKIRRRINQRLNRGNVASYRALVKAHEKPKYLKKLDWQMVENKDLS